MGPSRRACQALFPASSPLTRLGWQDADEPAVSDEAPHEGAQTYVWGTNVNVADATSKFKDFLTGFDDTPPGGGTPPLPLYVRKLHEIKQREARSLPLLPSRFAHLPSPRTTL